MRRAPYLLVAIVILAAPARAGVAENLYTARARDDGAPFDLVLAEQRREPFRSYVFVSGFHSRSAAGSRWLMCMYNDLAYKRGFKYWTAIYPNEPQESFVIGFYQTETTDLATVFGPGYNAKNAFPPKPMSVARWHETLCAWAK